MCLCVCLSVCLCARTHSLYQMHTHTNWQTGDTLHYINKRYMYPPPHMTCILLLIWHVSSSSYADGRHAALHQQALQSQFQLAATLECEWSWRNRTSSSQVCMHMFIHMWCMHVWVSEWVCVSVCVRVSVFVWVCMSMCVDVCVCITNVCCNANGLSSKSSLILWGAHNTHTHALIFSMENLIFVWFSP
jgi:hypothetical protein